MHLISALKMPRITFRKVVLLTALLLLVNGYWSIARRRWAERRAAFEQRLNITDPRMLSVYDDVKKYAPRSLDDSTDRMNTVVNILASAILRALQCDGTATNVWPAAAKASSLLDDPKTPQCFIDDSKTYKFLSFALETSRESRSARKPNKQNDVCLSSQLSVDSLFWVTEQMKTWSGRFSLAVFIPDVDYTIAMLMIRAMEFCDERIEQRVDFHFVYPVKMTPVLGEFETIGYNCSTIEQYNKLLVDTLRTSGFKRTIGKTKYPQNLLRNIARDRCYSEYSFTPDIDMIASPKMYENLQDFLSSRAYDNCDKCAYVIPTYEIALGERNPNDKNELLTYINEKKAQRFHIGVFKPNQENSNLFRWENPLQTSDINILYNITTFRQYWEPIYVTKSSMVPKFAECFVGYGFTRNSQVMEMEAAGYSWIMLDSPFLSHRGFQSTKGRSKYRRSQISENYKKYKKFQSETLKRYGLSQNDPRFGAKPKKKKKS